MPTIVQGGSQRTEAKHDTHITVLQDPTPQREGDKLVTEVKREVIIRVANWQSCIARSKQRYSGYVGKSKTTRWPLGSLTHNSELRIILNWPNWKIRSRSARKRSHKLIHVQYTRIIWSKLYVRQEDHRHETILDNRAFLWSPLTRRLSKSEVYSYSTSDSLPVLLLDYLADI